MKRTKYLPLEWAEKLPRIYKNIYAPLSYSEIRELISLETSDERRTEILNKSEKIPSLLSTLPHEDKEELLRDLDATSLLLMWSRNKQVFKFDKDFTDELVKTEKLKYTKDMFDYLPYECFYVDLSDNKELCESIIGEGFFVTVEKAVKHKRTVIHLSKITEKLFFTDTISLRNEDMEFSPDDIAANKRVEIMDDSSGEVRRYEKDIDGRAYRTLVLQILTYLTSVEPDVEENETTKATHRPYNPDNPKNKFSEVKMWDVGARIGNAFRNYKKRMQNYSSSGSATGTGTPKRPHIRRAHWHTFLYGHGENKVARAKWVAETFVGKGESPVTIHKTRK